MAKLAVLLLAVLLAAAATAASTAFAYNGATIPAGLRARRSRFLLAKSAAHLPPSYGCSRKTAAAVCLAPGSPGPACCDGQCVDTEASTDHCGGCNKVCKHDRVCCGGRCVDLLSDKDCCGKCFNQCNSKCTYGFCDYAR